jgi:uncharacterized protein
MSESTGPGLGAVSIVTLAVADVAGSTAFYTALGYPQRSSSVDGVISWFDLGGCYLGLYEEVALAVDTGFPADAVRPGPGFRGATIAVNLPSVEAVDAALARAVAAGATQTLAPVMTEYGVHHACFTDPDGHAWEVAYNPGFPIVDGSTLIP